MAGARIKPAQAACLDAASQRQPQQLDRAQLRDQPAMPVPDLRRIEASKPAHLVFHGNVATLMEGNRARMVFADPLYSLPIDGK